MPMLNRRKGSLLGIDARLGIVVVLVLLCFSSSAFAKGVAVARHSPTASFAYRVTLAQRLTLQLSQFESRFVHRRPKGAQRRHLIALSKARADALVTLAASNPDLALRWLLTPRQRAILRRVRGAAVESHVTLTGRYRFLARDAGTSDQLVSANGKRVVTLRSVTPLQLPSDALISVTGYRIGHVVVVPQNGVHSLRTATRALASTTVGTINTAVIGATFTDSTSALDLARIQAAFQGNPGHDVDSYFAEASYGKMTLAPSFFGPVTVPETTDAACNSSTLMQDIMTAANSSVDFTQFRRLIFVINCPQTMGDSMSEGPVTTPDGTITAATSMLSGSFMYSTFALAHEISHTLGSGNKHASYYDCLPVSFSPPTRFGQGCASDEYGDLFDVLGGGPDQFISQQDPYHKANAGWFTAANYPTVTTPGTSTYTLSPYELPSNGALALDIPRGNSGTYFTVEYRQPTGFDSWMADPRLCPGCTVTQGASIRLVGVGSGGGGGGGDTQLIDTTPGSIPSSYFYPVDDVRDGALLPGRTFTDPEFGISITTVSANASGLTLQVTLPPQTCTHASPTVSAVSPSSQSVGYGQTATYTFTLTNNDSAGCPANTFRYFSPGTEGLNVVASPDYLTLAPGASSTISLAMSAQPLATAGTWSFSSSNGRGGGYIYSNSLGTSAAVTSGFSFQLTTPADSTPPSAPSNVTAQSLGSRAIKVSWQPSSDNVGAVGYTVTSSNGDLYTTTGTSIIDPDVSSSSSYTYTVRAFDRAGNYSTGASASATSPARKDVTSPTPPVVTATANDHSVTVSWTPSTDNVGVAYYRITPCLVTNCVVPASVHSFTASGLGTRTQLNLQVIAVDGDGNWSDTSSGKYTVYTGAQGATPPSQPQRLVSIAGSFHRVTLSWAPSTDPAGVAGYYVYRNTRQIATVSGTSYTDTDVESGAQYYVQAFDAAGSLSAPSLAPWFLSPASQSSDSTTPTSAITALADGATVSGTVAVNATAADDVGVTRVQFYVDGVLKQTSTAAPYTLSWDTTLVGDGPHWLYVLAYDDAGNYGTDGGVMVTVDNSGSSQQAVSPPTSLTAEFGHSIDLSWTAPTGVNVANYIVDRDGTQIDTTTNTYYYDDSVNAGETYNYDVRAVDANGNVSAPSNVATASVPDTPPPATAPAAPALSGTPGSKVANLSWSTSSDGGSPITGYRIYRSTKSGGETLLKSVGLVTSYTDTMLSNGTHYFYEVSAVNAVGASPLSAEISVTPATPPSSPSPSVNANGVAGVVLTWSAPQSGGSPITGYNIYRGSTSGGETLWANVGAVTSFTDTSVSNGTTYYYKVSAVNAVGQGALSSEKTAKRGNAPSPPRSLTAATNSRGVGVALKWSSPSTNGGANVTGYQVYRGTASGGETLLTTVGNVTSFSDTSATSGALYFYVVVALNPLGASTNSNEAQATAK
jgi:fibronectin type 3 domain-containing protein